MPVLEGAGGACKAGLIPFRTLASSWVTLISFASCLLTRFLTFLFHGDVVHMYRSRPPLCRLPHRLLHRLLHVRRRLLIPGQHPVEAGRTHGQINMQLSPRYLFNLCRGGCHNMMLMFARMLRSGTHCFAHGSWRRRASGRTSCNRCLMHL